MRKYGIILLLVAIAGGAAAYYFMGRASAQSGGPTAAELARERREQGGGMRGGGFGGPGGGMGGRGPRPPMTVELAPVTRRDMIDTITVVGNLIGAATVDAVPRGQGRLDAVYVKLGDAVRRGQPIAKIEDRELVEQIRQAEATLNVSQATIRQRQADLKLAQNNMERSKSLYERDLLPRQTFDDTDARYQAAQAQLELSLAQLEQTRSRLNELKINLANTVITSPVDGFIGKRTLDPGASVGVNTSFISVVDIRTVRLVINVVEKDLRRIHQGTAVEVEVDAYPGEKFMGRVARLAPILDPATRTAQVEIEIPNSTFRLKPGMYARARFTVEKHDNALVVPTMAVVDLQGKIGVWQTADEGDSPVFIPVTTGIEQQDFTEITSGLKEGQRIITTGAGALRPGDRIVMAGQRGGGNRAGGMGGRGRRGGGAAGAAPGVNANQAQTPGR
ncbi:MAG TPA: efflux RND transporter periplasmic adaptor subunit [Vicinamibacterales bacterium]|nr:efflux RND transporter periplasmic adaptor subunit [Vicinamibacterales bacterium]